MKFEAKSLRSKVARRVFLLFVSCALIPVCTLAFVSFYQVSSQLRDQTQRQMEQAAKSQGMETYERLELLNARLQVVGLQSDPHALKTPSKSLKDSFSGLALLTKREAVNLYGEKFLAPILSEDQLQHLAGGKTLLLSHRCAKENQCIQLLRLLDSSDPKKGLLIGEVRPDYLWEADRLPNPLSICVFSNNQKLFCSTAKDASALQDKLPNASGTSLGSFQWSRSGQQSFDAAYWSLFLNPQYHTSSWTIVLSQPRTEALIPMEKFRRLFPFVILLAVWVVMLLSLVQIRRTLTPLERLKEGTIQISRQNFDSQVYVNSGDEFEELADSFNSMSHRLGRQFHALRTINDIDRAILESVERDQIIAGALQHMPFLLPAPFFCIAIFDSGRKIAKLHATERVGNENSARRLRTIETILSSDDLIAIQAHQAPRIVEKTSDALGYLKPIVAQGMSSFAIFPIWLDNTPYAALICAWELKSSLETDELVSIAQVADQLAVAFSNARLVEDLEQFHWGTLTALARAIDAKSSWTSGHSERVTNVAIRIAKEMGLGSNDLEIIHRGGLLHDIGKIGTPATVLDKPGKLDANELETMRNHVRIGLRILEPISAFKEALPIVAQHHEWFNGGGYPEGLKGEEIALNARIFAVADCYDAPRSDRPYREGLPNARVVEILKSGTGTQFDPSVVEAFLRVVETGVEMREEVGVEVNP